MSFPPAETLIQRVDELTRVGWANWPDWYQLGGTAEALLTSVNICCVVAPEQAQNDRLRALGRTMYAPLTCRCEYAFAERWHVFFALAGAPTSVPTS
jgi:hypothetical protein